MGPPHCEYGSGVHCKCAQGFRRPVRKLGSVVEDRFGAPYSNLSVKAASGDARTVRMNMHGENRKTFGGLIIFCSSICIVEK